MIGAIVGDIAGARFEFDNHKSKAFDLFVSCGKLNGSVDDNLKTMLNSSTYSDDSVMTLAIAKAILLWKEMESLTYQDLSQLAVASMREFGKMYPLAGYGGTFELWLHDETMGPYNSWGNGAAMRVSACGWAGRTLDEVKAMSRAVTEVTHNHLEGIKGAEATAVATFLARTGKSKEEIRSVIVRDYYPLDFTLDEIRPDYEFDVSCQGSVPQAIEAFMESTSFEDAIRNAVSIGGDSDTIAAICGTVAGAFYGVPDDIRTKAAAFLPSHLLETLHSFESKFQCNYERN
jgi:type I restriction enzyme M protein